MKLYQSVGPNPRVVLMYLDEKQIEVPRQFVDIQVGENRREPYLGLNPAGGTPLLELDDGSHLADSVAICEYFEDRHPSPPLIGDDGAARARTRGALRRIDHDVVVPMSNGFRSAEGLPMFKDRLLCIPEAAPGNKAYAADGLRQIDALLGQQDYVAGASFSLADIVLFSFVEFGAMVGQPLDPVLTNLAAWKDRVAGRPSAVASANPQNGIAVAA